jgi:hypothetical protein
MSAEVDSTERQLHHQGSLVSWLHGRKQDITSVPIKQEPCEPVLSPMVLPPAPHASVLLPHSVDYEASFPALLGPYGDSRNYVDHGQHEAFYHSGSAAAHSTDGIVRDDPITTFLELMLSQGTHHPPVVELPVEEQNETQILSVSLDEEQKFPMRSRASPYAEQPAMSMTTTMPSVLGDIFVDDGAADFSSREDTVFPRTLTKQHCGFDLAIAH